METEGNHFRGRGGYRGGSRGGYRGGQGGWQGGGQGGGYRGAAPQMKYRIGFRAYVLGLYIGLLLHYTAYDASWNKFQTSKASSIGTSRRQQCPDVLLQTGF